MMIAGKSIYESCETPHLIGKMVIPCYGRFGADNIEAWCRQCLMAKIRSLKDGLARVAEVANRERR